MFPPKIKRVKKNVNFLQLLNNNKSLSIMDLLNTNIKGDKNV